jgi:iron complex transport system ATP-binding protein
MIKIRDISFSYGKKQVLKNISLDVRAGECVAVLGNNGAGKSTFITCLNKIRHPGSGGVLINGLDMLRLSRQEIARKIAYVGQKSEISRITVFDSVLLGRKPHIKWSLSLEDLALCEEMLDRLGLTELKLRYLHQLSGGELQLVMLARAFVQQPKLLLLDEPTSNLDPKNQHQMLSLVRDIAREKQVAVLTVIHDLNLALQYCDKFMFIRDGLVYRFGDDSVVSPETLAAVYHIKAHITSLEGRKIAITG